MSTFFESLFAVILGAIMGGLVVFLVYREKLQKMQMAGQSRRISMLEAIAEHVGKVNHVFSKYASLIVEIGPKSERMSPKQQEELKSLSNELVTAYEEIAIAESKLLLLGEKRLELALKLYTSKMAQYRKQFYPGRYTQTDEATASRKEINQLREQFYDLLSQRYDQTMPQS